MSYEISAPVGGIAIETSTVTRSDPGHGSSYVWRVHQEARRRFPNATGFEIHYSGDGPRVTPRYARAATPATRRASSGGSQQDRLARRLAELEQDILRDQLREIDKTL